MAALASLNIRLLKDTTELVRLYNTVVAFQASFKRLLKNPQIVYKGRPLKLYVWIISQTDPFYQTFFRRPMVEEVIDPLFKRFYRDERNWKKIEDASLEKPSFLNPDDENKIAETERLPNGEAKLVAQESFLGSKETPALTPHLGGGVEKLTGSHLPGELASAPGVSAEGPTESHTGSEPGQYLRGETKLSSEEHLGGEQKAVVAGRIPLVSESKTVKQASLERSREVQGDNKIKRGFSFPKFEIPKVPDGLSTPIKNFMHRNLTLTKIAPIFTGGLGAIVGYGVTGTGIGALGGGGVGTFLPSLVKNKGAGQIILGGVTRAGNAGATFISGLSGGGGGIGGGFIGRTAGGAGKKVVIAAILGFIILAAFLVGFAPQTPQTTPGETQIATGSGQITGGSCPNQVAINQNKQNPSSCKYFGLGVNLFDTNISQTALDNYINKYSSIFINAGTGDLNQFRTRVNYIVAKSKEVGITPVLGLGYWKTESNFSTVGTRDLGCSRDAINFYEQVDCKLGINEFSNPTKNPITNCARSKDENSVACNALKGSRRTHGHDLISPINYPIATFDDFAEAYGPRNPGLEGPGKVNNNCISTYNKLVEVAKELNACVVSTPNPTATTLPPISGKLVTCPLEGKRVIGCGSWKSDTKFNREVCSGPRPEDRGHCGNTYGRCTAGSRREHSIDVDANPGEPIKLPFINGKGSTWYNPPGTRYGPLSSKDGGGYGHVFNTEVDGDIWLVHFVHMNENVIPPPIGSGYQSGDPVVTVADTPYDHLHVNIGKNPTGVNGGSGWLDPESLGMCTD